MSLTSANTCAGGQAINAERVSAFMAAVWRIADVDSTRADSSPARYNVSMTKPEASARPIAENRRARFEYFIEERLEAGLVLEGWEVKAMRAGRAQLAEAYVYIRNNEAFMTGAHIAPLNTASTHKVADPIRSRKLLLNRRELDHLVGAVERRGYTLVPLELYWKDGRAKLQLGLAKGKQKHDKRATEKDRDWVRDKARLLRRG